MDQSYRPVLKVPSRVVKTEPKKTNRKCTLDYNLPKITTINTEKEIGSNMYIPLHGKKQHLTPERPITPLRKSLSTPGKRKLESCEDTTRIKRLKSSEKCSIVPLYEDYQLLGDSQFLRFSEQLLSLKADYTDGIKRIGYCVSGQKIDDLRERLQKEEFEIHKNVVLLIGTNDFIQRTDYSLMCASYSNILEFLKTKCSNIILMTVPPVAKFEKDIRHWRFLQQFNQFVTTLVDGECVNAIDLCSVFISYSNTVSKDYFEKIYCNPVRPDLIHLNKKGFLMLRFLMDVYFLEKNINSLVKPLNKRLFQ